MFSTVTSSSSKSIQTLLGVSTIKYYQLSSSNRVSTKTVSTRSSSTMLSTTHQIVSTLLVSSTVSASSTESVSLSSTSSSTQSQLVTSLALVKEATFVTTNANKQLSTLFLHDVDDTQSFNSSETEVAELTSGVTSPHSTAYRPIDDSQTTNQSQTEVR